MLLRNFAKGLAAMAGPFFMPKGRFARKGVEQSGVRKQNF
jgi:hypothetical protein